MAGDSHTEFVSSLLAEFPDLRGDIEECDGQLQVEMEAFAQFTQGAKASGDLATYERCVALADRLLAGADAVLGAALRASYVEHLEFEGSRGPAAWQLVPPRLQSVWNQIAAENRRLMSLPQKQGGQRAHERDFAPHVRDDRPHGPNDRQPGRKPKQRGKKRFPRKGRPR